MKKMLKKHKLFLLISFLGIILFLNYNFAIYFLNYIISLEINETINIFTLNAEESISNIFYIMTIFTFIVIIPFLVYLFYHHYSDALLQKEKRVIKIFPFVYLWGLIGLIFGFYIGLYIMLPFMLKYNSLLGLNNSITLSNLLKTLINSSLVFFFIFQLPFIIKYLVQFNIVKKETLKKHRKLIFFISLVLGGVLSPTELFTMFIITIPIYLFFEIGLLISKNL